MASYAVPFGQSVAPGCDADIVVFDPRRKLITAADQHSKTDCNLYEAPR